MDECKMPKVNVMAEENRIKQLVLDMGDAFQRKDVNAFMKCFHRDIMALYPNTPLMRGIKPWRRFIEAAIIDNISVKYDEIIVETYGSHDFGYAIGIFSGVNKAHEGQVKFTSRFHATMWKIDGECKVVAISYNR